MKFLILLFLTFSLSLAQADQPQWKLVVHKDLHKKSPKNFAERNHLLFKHFIEQSLYAEGKIDFLKMIDQVKNNIFWTGNRSKNIYIDAFQRSYPSLKRLKTNKKIPEIVFLIPYIESLWHPKSGKSSADYGYWQLVPAIVQEIQSLDTTPKKIRKAKLDHIRSSFTLSTQVALIHLRRYYFYFAKVANHSESDAWLFSILAYNWGAGNVKRMLSEMESKQIKVDFSNFYHYLHKKYQANKSDRSMKAALEYLPSLWNIAQVIRQKTT
jgi:hypothetical protein